MVKRYFRLVDKSSSNSRVLYSGLVDFRDSDIDKYWGSHIVIENWVKVFDTILDGGDVIIIDTINNDSSELLYRYTDNLINKIRAIYANRQGIKRD